MKKRVSTTILVIIFLIGLSLLLYPTVSDYINQLHQSSAIADYTRAVKETDSREYKKMWKEAVKYNRQLAETGNNFQMNEEERREYNRLLDVSGTGIMGYIEIPSIRCKLPLYHGSDESTLQIAIGHIMGTSLPTGGKNTHCVVSGHRGLPSAKLFSDLDQLKEGDIFMVNVLDKTLTYEVDRISIVEPDNTDLITLEPGRDYCTLVTCTPYGINTHRLLVRGHRTENIDEGPVRITADAVRISRDIIAMIMASMILLILWICMAFRYRKRRKHENSYKNY